METVAEGLATRTGFEVPQGIMREMLDDFVLVSEKEMAQAVTTLLECTHNLVEHAGAAPLAAALKLADRLEGKKVVLVMSGSNITIDQLRAVLA